MIKWQIKFVDDRPNKIVECDEYFLKDGFFHFHNCIEPDFYTEPFFLIRKEDVSEIEKL